MIGYRRYMVFVALALSVLACAGGKKDAKTADEKAVTLFVETGNLQAVSSTAIVMPWYNWSYGQPQITFLEKEGTLVEPGDVVAELDRSGVQQALDKARDELAMATADLNSMKMNHATATEKLNADLQQRLSRHLQAQIDTQRVAYESKSRKAEKLLELEKSGIELDKARRKIETTKLVQEQDLKIQLAKVEQTRTSIATAEKTLESFTLRAPARGMVVYSINRQNRERIKIQVGDKLYPGRPIIQLPDMSSMKAETAVNETDISKVRLGQKMRVRLDAYPEKVFDGVITSLALTCHTKNRDSKIKVFDVEVLVEGSERILKPGMTVSCEFLSTVEPAIALP